jgi:hypothetical protein
MRRRLALSPNWDAHKIQQAVKWAVYTLLIVNFVFYIFEDWNRAFHTLDVNSTFLDWTSEFATSIDESAWFLLLFMFELETYVIADKDWSGWIERAVRGARMLCYVMLAHSVYAFTFIVINLQPTTMVEGSLCDMTGDNVSYVYNLEYTEVNEQTCGGLSAATEYYQLADDPLVSDMPGLILERRLAWADLIEVVVWLLILLAIEVVVRFQSRGVTGGTTISAINMTKLFLYGTLALLAIYWASLGHWLYFWDEFVWIAGFAAIEMNISEWRDEMLEETTS